MSAPTKAELEEIAAEVRRFLETVWPDWHRLRGRSLPDPLSLGTCQTSSLFLAAVLHAHGHGAHIEQGNDPEAEEGYLHDGAWHGHAWVECGGWILDISADQFGRPPVLLAPVDDPAYRRGADTAFESAKRQRRELVDAAMDKWRRRATAP
ncbi:hypothetical protein [Nisaea acidiphila]|uniref:hypothetical protein n=1 Tax=Nisaea acidiphila TaxID=1862145 RepID=UPI0027E35CB1|nr:hypothetical protein [Nisaea acidiphila]